MVFCVSCRSSYAASLYLQKQPNHGEVYVLGEKGIYDELEAVGIKCHGTEDNGCTDILCFGRRREREWEIS